MTIEIITAHEADQLIRMRRPLAWPPHTTCNGNCQQGRACDCTSNVDTDEAAKIATFTMRDHVRFLAPVLNVCLILLLFVLYRLGVFK